MNCQDIKKFAYTYLDGEFEGREQAEFETHLGMCPPCKGVVERDASFRDAVRRHLSPNTRDPELQDRVHRRLVEAHRQARMSRTLAVPMALAASVALALISWQAIRQGPSAAADLAGTVPTEALAMARAEPAMTTGQGAAPVGLAAAQPEAKAQAEATARPEAPVQPSTTAAVAAVEAALRVARAEPSRLPMAGMVAAPVKAPARPQGAVRQVANLGPAAQVMDGSLNADSLARSSPFGAIRSPANLRAMVRSHVQPLPPEVRGPSSVVQRFLRERLPFVGPPPIAEGVGVQLHGARLGQFDGRPVIHYSYEAWGKPMTVLRFVNVPGGEPFDDPEVERASPGDPMGAAEGALLDRLAGYSILHSLRGGELTCVISELGGNELHNLIRAPTVL